MTKSFFKGGGPFLNVFLILVILSSCNSIEYPPIDDNASQQFNPGQFTWHDLATTEPELAKDFYTSVFGWEYEALGSGDDVYYIARSNGTPVSGIFKLDESYGEVAEWVGSVSVPNVKATVSLNLSEGGKTIYPVTELNGRGTSALVQDKQGAILAFLKSQSGDPIVDEVPMNSFLWDELWTNDLEASLDLYKIVLGYDSEEVEDDGKPYHIFSRNGVRRAGAMKNPVEGARTAWMPYIRVGDVEATTAKAEKAGAHLMLAPSDEVRNGHVAIMMDPSGGQFAIQKWPID